MSVPLLPINVLALNPAYCARTPVSLCIAPTRCQVDDALVRAATDTTAGTGRATGVRYVDVHTKEAHEVFARVVFLAGSALGSTRVLLNSTSPRFPNGMANASGELGHNLMDHHFQVGARGELEGLLDRYYQGNRPNGIDVNRA